jgi:DNA mismatch repair protein MutS
MDETTEISSIVIDYFKLTKQYQYHYGKNTIVLLQVGAFFEVYGLRHPTKDTYEYSPITSFSEICDLNIADKKITLGSHPSNQELPPFPMYHTNVCPKTFARELREWTQYIPSCHVVMAGVRDYVLEKYVQKLVDNGFTVVVYVQEKQGKHITRKLQEIYSPGTYLAYDTESNTKITNHITCIWIDKLSHKTQIRKGTKTTGQKDLEELSETQYKYQSKEEEFLCGIASLNIFTGESFLFEYQTPFLMNPTTFDELERHLITIAPSEIILISEISSRIIDPLIKYMGIESHIPIHKIWLKEDGLVETETTKKAKNCTKQTYINHVLSTWFSEDMFHFCMEFHTYIFATQAFCYLLNFVSEHNADLIKKIHLPTFTNTSQRMILANHTLKQLNIIPDGQTHNHSRNLSSVSGFINRCCTAMGKRRFHHQLTHPTMDETWLQQEYDHIDHIQTTYDQEAIKDMRRRLHTMKDIEKMARLLVSKRISPSSMYQMYKTIQEWTFIRTHYVSYTGAPTSSLRTIPAITEPILSFLEQHFVLENCAGVQSMKEFEQPILQSNQFPEIASLLEKRNVCMKQLESYQIQLNQLISKEGKSKEIAQPECVRMHKTEKGGISFQITKKRAIILKELIASQLSMPWIQGIQIVKATANYDEIQIPIVKETANKLQELEIQINDTMTNEYKNVLQILTDSWYETIESIAQQISHWDVILTKAFVAQENHYCRPVLGHGEDSWMQAYGLRHALIEKIQTQEHYVTNDVFLGGDANPLGILLYGTNAVGKTSLIRAIGIAIILAQCGCYVPCSQFVYRPYHAIYSRILGNDNLFKGLSTFAVEMSELRLILKMSDKHSLILGDELCSGTEIESALSIFMAGIMKLHMNQSTFLFATHFHEILQFQEMSNVDRVSVKHMSVVYDAEQDMLIYDRLLKDGPGNGTYGIEVAKSMHMDPEFLETAYQLRNRYFSKTKSPLEHTVSHYNSKKICGICEICNEKIGEEIHHIQYQQYADADGFIDHIHKNHTANLMSICKICHDKLHSKSENKKIVRKKTTKGYKLIGTE